MYNSTSSTTQSFYSTFVSNSTTSYTLVSNFSSSVFYKTTTTFVDAAQKYAVPIWVGWTGVSSPTTTIQTNLTNATIASTAPTDIANNTTKHGLSTGASAGIGVGAGLGGLCLLLAAIFVYRRQKKKPTGALVPSHEKPELSEDATIKPKELSDVQEKRVYEADTIHPPVELG
jgi:hypothetical protein